MSQEDLLADLIDAAGADATLQFIESRAGQNIMVPRHAEGSRLAELHGTQIACVLVAYRGGEIIMIPQFRAWRIRTLSQRGLTRNEIASRTGCSIRRVYSALAGISVPTSSRMKARDTRQMDMIDFLARRVP